MQRLLFDTGAGELHICILIVMNSVCAGETKKGIGLFSLPLLTSSDLAGTQEESNVWLFC